MSDDGGKWWTCCNTGVADLDDFTEVEGCKRKDKHLFLGSQGTKTSSSTPTHRAQSHGPSQGQYGPADEQLKADRALAERLQNSEYLLEDDRELSTRLQDSAASGDIFERSIQNDDQAARTEYHFRSTSVIGAISSSRQPKNSVSSAPSYIGQPFGPDAPEGYQYQYSDCTGKRKALLIGINSSVIWNPAAYLHNDYGFEKADVVTLSDQEQDPVRQPTKQNIGRAIEWLVNDAQTNDSLFFCYAGTSRA